MRSHAKASTAGSTQRQASRTRLGLTRLTCLAAISLLALLAGATPALGAVVSDRPLLFSFDGSDTTAGAFTGVNTLDIDQASGTVYVIDQGKNVLSKFDAAGVAQSFSATGQSSLNPSFSGVSFNSFSDVAVDNYGLNAGRIHVMREFGPVKAFSPAGTALWELGGFSDICGLAVDTDGNPWIGDWTNKKAREYASSGSPPAEVGFVSTGSDRPCRLDVDSSGNVYVNRFGAGVDKYVGGVKGPTIDSASSKGVTVDQSSATGHVFTLHGGNFNEYDSTGALIGTFGADAIGTGEGIAYNSSLDRVYVSDGGSDTVKVFGPAVTSTVPDTTIEATTEVGISKAKFNGKVNPQSVPNSYYFEWKQGTGSSWGGAKSSTPQSLPEDSSDHAVSLNATGLVGNTTYQVRLVGTNTATGLKAASSADTFTTTAAAQAPAVTIATPVAGTTTAQINGTVNPREDAGTTWRLQTSTDPACTSGFTDQPLKNLNSEASTPVAVAEELTGLDPARHYCVRIKATNSFGTTTSEVKEFTTDAVPPAQVSTAFAAPRTDTTARLNGRVNPEGAPLTYHFEYSDDGGETWIALPEHEDTGEIRKQIVVGEELSGLQPSTTYQYRFFAETSGGPASPQGVVKEFTTRSSAEMQPPPRGFELVNSPNKGNQNVRAEVKIGTSPASEDGEKAIWNVLGGVPGGNIGAGATFLATRTETGWHSQSLIPPAAEQAGQGRSGYGLNASTPDLSSFFLNSGVTALEAGRKLVRVDAHQNESLLLENAKVRVNGDSIDFTDDGKHVLLINYEPIAQLVDVGDGSPEVISVMPDGLPNQCGLPSGTTRGASFIGPSGIKGAGQWRPGYHMISTTDASRVYFQAAANGSANCSTAPFALYVRDRESEETLLIDSDIGSGEPHFIRAAPDGRTAYFLSSNKLDPGDTNSSVDVYRWDEAAGESSCVTCVIAEADPIVATLPSVLVSDDFSHVYFETNRQLIPGEGKAGEVNVYVLDEDGLRFVATTSIGAEKEKSAGVFTEAEVSSNGDVLLFKANGSAGFTSKPNTELTADRLASTCTTGSGQSGPCIELFRYDDRDSSLECVSCRQGGITTYAVGGSGENLGGSQYEMSADGDTVAFVTQERLVDEDVNNGADVYEWRNGVRRLITDGVSSFPEGFGAPEVMAVSEDGRDVFFGVVDPDLTGFEQDGLKNLYDARIGGGFEAPSPVPHCDGESCQGPPQAPPPLALTASAGFSGRGNVVTRQNCAQPSRQARKLSRAAQRLRRQARRAANPRQAQGLRRRAARLAKSAHRHGLAGKRCRRSNRGASR